MEGRGCRGQARPLGGLRRGVRVTDTSTFCTAKMGAFRIKGDIEKQLKLGPMKSLHMEQLLQ